MVSTRPAGINEVLRNPVGHEFANRNMSPLTAAPLLPLPLLLQQHPLRSLRSPCKVLSKDSVHVCVRAAHQWHAHGKLRVAQRGQQRRNACYRIGQDDRGPDSSSRDCDSKSVYFPRRVSCRVSLHGFA
jgi:hypothetical protein